MSRIRQVSPRVHDLGRIQDILYTCHFYKFWVLGRSEFIGWEVTKVLMGCDFFFYNMKGAGALRALDVVMQNTDTLREEIFAGINFCEFGFTEDFAGINSCELSLTRDFAGINFRESALLKDFAGVNLTFAFRNIFSTTLFCGFENNFS